MHSCEWNQVQSQDLNEHHLLVITYHLSLLLFKLFISNNQTFIILLLQNWIDYKLLFYQTKSLWIHSCYAIIESNHLLDNVNTQFRPGKCICLVKIIIIIIIYNIIIIIIINNKIK